jgi:tRNA uridine 5-carboxymethylaminomethyl modification enzyme
MGLQLGLVGRERRARFENYVQDLDDVRSQLTGLTLTPNEAAKHGLKINQDGQRRTAYELLSYPDMDLQRLGQIWPELNDVGKRSREAIEIEAAYAVYLDRQASEAAETRREEERLIPDDLDFGDLPGLSAELKSKLARFKPRNIAQAAKIDGMTPAAITLLLTTIKKREMLRKAS